MPRLDVPIGPDGPIIDVSLRIGAEHEEALVSRGLSVASPCSVPGLVDTGARVTAINLALARSLSLPVHDWQALRSSVLGEEDREAPIYVVRMTFGPIDSQDRPRWRTIRAAGVTVVSPGAMVLIGQDLLASCRFTYDGRKGRLMMSY